MYSLSAGVVALPPRLADFGHSLGPGYEAFKKFSVTGCLEAKTCGMFEHHQDGVGSCRVTDKKDKLKGSGSDLG